MLSERSKALYLRLVVVALLLSFSACRKAPPPAPIPAPSPISPPAPRAEATPIVNPGLLVGTRTDWPVPKSTNIKQVAARAGESAAVLARTNGLKPGSRVRKGQILHIENRHIVPIQMNDGIVVNLGQLMLFAFKGGRVVGYYPVGVGKPDWPTPTAHAKVIEKRLNPTWHVPESIQDEMEEKGREVLTEVPPGPDNPLAGYWIGLSVGGYGIHGTNAPATVYDYRSHGCIRMNRADAAKLFNYAYIGQPVEIIYKPVLLTRTKDGKIFAEVHKDVYNESRNPVQEIQRSVESGNLNNHLDWNRIKEVAQDKEGIAREVDSGNPSKPSS